MRALELALLPGGPSMTLSDDRVDRPAAIPRPAPASPAVRRPRGVVRLTGLSKSYGEQVILDGIDLRGRQGRVRRPARSLRHRQDHAAAHPGPARGRHLRPGHHRRDHLGGLPGAAAGAWPSGCGATSCSPRAAAATHRARAQAALEEVGLADQGRRLAEDALGRRGAARRPGPGAATGSRTCSCSTSRSARWTRFTRAQGTGPGRCGSGRSTSPASCWSPTTSTSPCCSPTG